MSSLSEVPSCMAYSTSIGVCLMLLRQCDYTKPPLPASGTSWWNTGPKQNGLASTGLISDMSYQALFREHSETDKAKGISAPLNPLSCEFVFALVAAEQSETDGRTSSIDVEPSNLE
jgi:hypothetical protein